MNLGTKKIESVNDLVINSYVTNLKFHTCTLGIGDNFKASKENRSIVYPNPASRVLNIDFLNEGTTKEIKIYTLLGQMLYSTKTDNDKIAIDVQSLNVKGAVIVETKENNQVSNHKVILQ